MPCQFIRFPNGGSGIICGPRSRAKPKPCWECHRPGLFLCDGPSNNISTRGCNRPLCVQHRTQAGAGVDYCSECAAGIGVRRGGG